MKYLAIMENKEVFWLQTIDAATITIAGIFAHDIAWEKEMKLIEVKVYGNGNKTHLDPNQGATR